MPRTLKQSLYVIVSPEIEAAARADYEASRKCVGGRPKWEKLDPCCPYDMGMRNHAIEQAEAALAAADPAVAALKSSTGVI